jgi:hypothetical protein
VIISKAPAAGITNADSPSFDIKPARIYSDVQEAK